MKIRNQSLVVEANGAELIIDRDGPGGIAIHRWTIDEKIPTIEVRDNTYHFNKTHISTIRTTEDKLYNLLSGL